MKKVFAFTVGIFLAMSLYSQENNQVKKLSITITNIQKNGKTLYVGIYRKSDEFSAFNKYWKNVKVNTTNNSMKVEFDIPYGEYAVAVSHDLNGNGKLDKNLFGYPSEPFGFSNNFKPKLSSPDFSDCKFSFTQQTNSLTIKLID
jgi:uncharacterized protein (DUF2141 family)